MLNGFLSPVSLITTTVIPIKLFKAGTHFRPLLCAKAYRNLEIAIASLPKADPSGAILDAASVSSLAHKVVEGA